MYSTDPIADMLTRIRNAVAVKHDSVLVPHSNVKGAVARIMKEDGFIDDFEILRNGFISTMRLHLRYGEKREPIITGLKRVSRPGLRKYVGSNDIPRIFGGMGITIMSTSQGIMKGSDAKRLGIGGELLCYMW